MTVRCGDQTLLLQRLGLHGNGRTHPAAVLVSPERYEQLMNALEELEDAAAVDAALAEGGEPIPWEPVRRDLGWTE